MNSKSFPSRVFHTLALVCLIAAAGCREGGDAEGSKIDVAAQLEKLKGSDETAKQDALVELAKAGPRAEPALQQLTTLLKDPNETVRQLSAYALMQLGPKAASALPALKELLKDSHQPVAMNAVNAIRAIDPKGSGDLKVINVTGQ